ncbi:hypothetical protein DFJ73DRAFT_795832 [Zopfochytrium polystomum]|nr:hypothetical protein DFJ73DRAFT_795832 [Zopfochytrium polystomum]
MLQPQLSLLLSNLTGVVLFAPCINASVSMLNLVFCISLGSGADQKSSNNGIVMPTLRKVTLTPLQIGIIVATAVSFGADFVEFYSCIRQIYESNTWPDFPKWMVAFNALKRVHSIVSVHISFLRFQIITGRFKPSGNNFQSLTGNIPALISTLCYTATGFTGVAFQLKAYLDNNWVGAASRASPEFAVYRALTLTCTLYFALLELVTNISLIALHAQMKDVSNSTTQLDKVKKYYNHWINLAYEIILIVSFVICSVVYFYDPFFNSGVFLEQAVLSFVSWNGLSMRRILWANVGGSSSVDADDADAAPGNRLFVVADVIPKLYEWSPKSPFRSRLLSHVQDSAVVKSLDWCPASDSTSSSANLLAIGTSAGRTAILRCTAGAPDADGPVSTVVNDFFARSQRPCNVVKFCPVDPKLLLSGFDKVRSDFSLLVWNTDLRHSTTTASQSEQSIFQGASSDVVHSAAWFPDSPTFLASISGKFIKLFDLRAPQNSSGSSAPGGGGGTPTFSSSSLPQIATRAVHGIVVDPFDGGRRFSCFGDPAAAQGGSSGGAPGGGGPGTATILVWDIRHLVEPLVVLDSGFRNVASVQWNPSRRGTLAAAGREGTGPGTALGVGRVRIWELVDAFSGRGELPAANDLGTGPSSSWTGFDVGAPNVAPESPRVGGTESGGLWQPPPAAEAWKVRQVIPFPGAAEPVAAFSWAPAGSPSLGEMTLVVATSRSVEFVAVPEAPIVWWGARGDLFALKTGGDAERPRWTGRKLSVNQEAEEIGEVIRKRAKAGYSIKAQKNLSVISGHPQLERLWQWISDLESIYQSRPSTSGPGNGAGMYGGGHHRISSAAAVAAGSASSPSLGIAQRLFSQTFSGVEAVISLMVETGGSSELDDENGNAASQSLMAPTLVAYTGDHRRFARRMLGAEFDETNGDLEPALSKLERRGDFERSALLSVIRTARVDRAIKALNASPDERHRLVAATLAGVQASAAAAGSSFAGSGSLPSSSDSAASAVVLSSSPSAPIVNPWTALCRSLSKDLQSPFLRCIFAIVARCASPTPVHASEDWSTALDISGLSLKDQVATALKFLPDLELLAFLRNRRDAAVQLGNLDGLFITGLSAGLGISLLERYVDTTGDLQTACLLASANPMFHKNAKVEEWTESYRDLLDRFQLFIARARFDVARARPGGPAPPPQVFIKCNFCGKPITLAAAMALSGAGASDDGYNAAFSGTGGSGTGGRRKLAGPGGSIGGSAGAAPAAMMMAPAFLAAASGGGGTACPHCRNPLPRCAVCLLHMKAVHENPHFGLAAPGARGYAAAVAGGGRGDGKGAGAGGAAAAGAVKKGTEMWFTWCQTCRHGGHGEHLTGWFKRHDECPVTGCRCRCQTVQGASATTALAGATAAVAAESAEGGSVVSSSA